MKILWENLQIVSDEYLVGEVLRKVIRTQAPLYPKEDVDFLQTDRDVGDAAPEFKRVRDRWKNSLPAWEEEPEGYLYDCFDKYKVWNPSITREKYYRRWASYLKQEKYC